MAERIMSSTRAHPRVELLAQVQVKREFEVHIMSTANISLGGVFIVGEPTSYPELQVGVDVELAIFNPDTPGDGDVSLRARVVRIEPEPRVGVAPGFGLRFTQLDRDCLARLHRLIALRTTQDQPQAGGPGDA